MKNILLVILCTITVLIEPAEEKEEPGAEAARVAQHNIALQRVSTYKVHAQPVRSLSWHPRQAILASGSSKNLYPGGGSDIEEHPLAICHKAHITNIKLNRNITSLDWLAERGLIIGSTDGNVDIVDIQGNIIRQSTDKRYKRIYALNSHPVKQKVAIAPCGHGPIAIWDIAADKYQIFPFTEHDQMSVSISYSTDGRLIASGDMDGHIHLWDPDSSSRIQMLKIKGDKDQYVTIRNAGGPNSSDLSIQTNSSPTDVKLVRWNPDGTLLSAVLEGDNKMYTWDTRTYKPLHTTRVVSAVTALGWSPDGSYVASGSSDGVVRLWNSNTGKCTAATLLLNNGAVTALDWSSVTNQLAAGDQEGTVHLLKVGNQNLDDSRAEGEE